MLEPGRQAYLDRVRGIAVLVMIEAHVIDGWTRVGDRTRPAFEHALILGGFGAPLFLFLAGVSLVLSAESKSRKTGDVRSAWRAVRNRGWEIFGLAFLFRLQSFILTGGYSPISLLKVDILNVMGPAIAAAAFAGGRMKTASARAVLFGIVAIVMAMLTPVVRMTSALNWVPVPISWYLRPSGTHTNFTLFPWAAFVFAGGVVGVVINQLRASEQATRWYGVLAAVSVLVAACSYGASFLPSMYERSDFWTSSPTFFFLRVGVIALLLPLAFFWERAPWRGVVSSWSPLQEFGRASLFVYWIHVEMVYGFISWPLRHRLSFETAIVAYVLFSAFLLAIVMAKNRRMSLRKPAGVPLPGATPAAI